MVEAVKRGFPQREIADAAFRYQQEVDAGRARGRRRQRATAQEDDGGARHSCASTPRSRASRSTASRPTARAATPPPSRPRSASCARPRRSDGRNLMPGLLDCARAHATEGEIVEALQTVFGTYAESPVF